MELAANQSRLEEKDIKILKLLQDDSKSHDILKMLIHGFIGRWAPEFIDYKSVEEANIDYKSVEKNYSFKDYGIKLHSEVYTYTQTFKKLLLCILETPHKLGVWLTPIKFAFLAIYYNRCWIMRTQYRERRLKVVETLDYLQRQIRKILCHNHITKDEKYPFWMIQLNAKVMEFESIIYKLKEQKFSEDVFETTNIITYHLNDLFLIFHTTIFVENILDGMIPENLPNEKDDNTFKRRKLDNIEPTPINLPKQENGTPPIDSTTSTVDQENVNIENHINLPNENEKEKTGANSSAAKEKNPVSSPAVINLT